MIKKFIGVVTAIATLALIVMTALGAGTYQTMLPESLFAPSAGVESVELPAEVDVVPAEMPTDTSAEAAEQVTE